MCVPVSRALQAVVTISGAASSLGVILSANGFTAKLFGHSVSQLERRNITVLLPLPFSTLHDGFLRKYLETGVGRLVDYTRVVMGLHKHGHAFLMLLSVRETTTADKSLAFVGIMRALPCSEHQLVIDSDGRITACSLESLGLLGLTPEVVAMERPRMSDWVVEWNHVQDALAQDTGTKILVTPPRDVAANEALVTGARDAVVDAGVWIHAHLQSVALPNNESVLVLHWHHMPTDKYLVRQLRSCLIRAVCCVSDLIHSVMAFYGNVVRYITLVNLIVVSSLLFSDRCRLC